MTQDLREVHLETQPTIMRQEPGSFNTTALARTALWVVVPAFLAAMGLAVAAPDAPDAPADQAEVVKLRKQVEDLKAEVATLRQGTPPAAAGAKADAPKPAAPDTQPAAPKPETPGTAKPETPARDAAKPASPESGFPKSDGIAGRTLSPDEPAVPVPQGSQGRVTLLPGPGEKPPPPKAAGKGQEKSPPPPVKMEPVPDSLRRDFRLPNGVLMRLRGESWVSEQPFQNQTEVTMLAAGLNRSPNSPQVKELVAAGYTFKAAMDGSLMFTR